MRPGQQNATALPAHLRQRTTARYNSQPDLNGTGAYPAEFTQNSGYYGQNQQYPGELQSHNAQYAQEDAKPGYYDQEYKYSNPQSYGSTGSYETSNYGMPNYGNQNYVDQNTGNYVTGNYVNQNTGNYVDQNTGNYVNQNTGNYVNQNTGNYVNQNTGNYVNQNTGNYVNRNNGNYTNQNYGNHTANHNYMNQNNGTHNVNQTYWNQNTGGQNYANQNSVEQSNGNSSNYQNAGYQNIGNYNYGNHHYGHQNTENEKIGNQNTDNQNYGSKYTANPNAGNPNSGIRNAGNSNFGNQYYGNQYYGSNSYTTQSRGNQNYGSQHRRNESYERQNLNGDQQAEVYSPAPSQSMQNNAYGRNVSTSSLPVSAKHTATYPAEPSRASSMGPRTAEPIPPAPPPHAMSIPAKSQERNMYMHDNNTEGNVTRSKYFHNGGSSTSLASAPGNISIYAEPPVDLNRLSMSSTGSASSASTALSIVSGQSPASTDIPVSSSRSSAKQPDRISRISKLYGRQQSVGSDGDSNQTLLGQPQPGQTQPGQSQSLPNQRVRHNTGPSSNNRQVYPPTKAKPFHVPLSISQTALNLSNHAVRNPQTQGSTPSGLMDSALPRTAAPMAPLHLDLDIPPVPFSQSEPATPIVPPVVDYSNWSPSKRGTPSRLARIFGVKGRSETDTGAGGHSRTGTPSIASRISSRISSRLSSNSSNRGSALKDPSASTSSLLEASIIAEPKELQNDWPVFEPRRMPIDAVVKEFASLGTPRVSLFDIDPALEGSMPQAINPNKPDMRQFATRGIYYLGEAVSANEKLGATDDDGNYKSVKGEQLGYRYNVVDELGRGSFGTVIRCRDHRTGRMVAVKVTANRAEIQGQARIEAKMLRALLVDHKGESGKHHFLRYIEHFQFQGHLCIATELLGPNLFEMSKRNSFKGLSEPTVQYISRQLVEGLEFLVNQNIIHCDLKPENILVSDTEKCQVKIVDFGSSCYERSRVYTYIQSRFYRAPEILLGMPYGPAIDMWSLGAIIPELLLGRPIFPSVDEADQVALMCQVIGSPDQQVMWKCRRAAVFLDITGVPLSLKNSKGDVRKPPGETPLSSLLKHCSPEAIDFCSKMLQWAPEKRLTAAKAVYHPFVLSQ